MADTKISALSAVTDVQDTDEFVLARSGTTKKIDASDLRTGIDAELDYQEKTSTTSVTGTSTASADTHLTANALALNGSTRIMVEFYAPLIDNPAGGSNRFSQVWLFDAIDGGAAAAIGQLAQIFNSASAVIQVPVHVRRYLTPASGSHVFSIRGVVSSGTGTIYGGAGGTAAQMPSFLRITRA